MPNGFLGSARGRDWRSERTGTDTSYFIGEGSSSLEIVVTETDGRPTKEFLQNLYSDRRGQRVNPILVVAIYADEVSLCGPSGEEPPVYHHVDSDQAERVCESALDEPGRLAAERFLSNTLPQLEEELTGLRNQGLLSTHELQVGVPERDDWDDSCDQAIDALAEDPRDLLEGLNFEIERLTDQSSILKDTSDGHERAVAVFLREDEEFDHAQDRFVGQSPVAYALNEADKQNLEYVIGSSGQTLRLYTTNPDAGFGSRGRTDTYVEVNTDLLTHDKAGYLWLLFSANALRADGTLRDIMERSKDYAADLGARLRERIYDDVVPDLAEAIAAARDLTDPTKEELDETYEMALVLLYRLLFISYAEDEEFLPRRRNSRYDQHSMKRKARELHEFVQDGGEFDSNFTEHWDDVMHLSRAIHYGHDELGLPAYDGRLLSEDENVSEAGAKLSEIQLDNSQFGPVLVNLLIDETVEGYQGPVDFRNIGVREFGVIYEGLLESELSVADDPLGTDSEGRYVPVDPEEVADSEIVVEEGQVYLHGQSGERKATGTYYTKTRFVEHLLDYSLEPALDEHIERIDELREAEGDSAAAEAFFDIRVADIAMGSGHFLVGAVDRIESRLYSYLTEKPLAPVEEELDNLEEAALAAFDDEEYGPTVERGQLLRRQVARRSIYGVDLNPLATELARLSIWVHTFVPGLPLTFLDYNLVTGDSLAGIGTVDEVTEILDVDQTSLGMFAGGDSVMNEIRDDIAQLGKFADASAEQVQEARETREEIEKNLEQVHARFDILAASRIDDEIDANTASSSDIEDVTELSSYDRAQSVLESTNPLHFPAAFPEVFDGDSSGFDVIVGNPPWEEATLEEDEFWMRYEPGLMGNSQTRQEEIKSRLRDERPDLVEKYESELESQEKVREILKNGPYPGMGTGDPDMYKAFYWRFWNLISTEGEVGVVLPRSAFIAAGSEEFRRTLLDEATVKDLTFLKNKDGWVFDNMEHRYTIALLGFEKSEPDASTKLPLRGPFPDLDSYQAGLERGSFYFELKQARNWTGSAAFPLLPSTPESVKVFKKLTTHPPLDKDEPDEWRARPNTELHATNDKTMDDGTRLMHFVDDPPDGYWPIFKGASFAPPDEVRWINDTGVRYAWGDPDVLVPFLDSRRESKGQHWASAFYEMSEDWLSDRNTLPCLNPRVAFRDVTNRTNQRTVCAALVPPKVFLANTAPYFLWPRGDERDEAYLLGILASIPLDWYARRFVETHVNYHILNAFPIPRPGRDSSLRERVIALSGRLAAKDDRYQEWAQSVGVEHGSLEKREELEKIHELDAVVAHLYGLSRDHVEVIFETFHEGWDYHERLDNVLEYYDEWAERLPEGATAQDD